MSAATLSRARRNLIGVRGSMQQMRSTAQAWADRYGVRVAIRPNRPNGSRSSKPLATVWPKGQAFKVADL